MKKENKEKDFIEWCVNKAPNPIKQFTANQYVNAIKEVSEDFIDSLLQGTIRYPFTNLGYPDFFSPKDPRNILNIIKNYVLDDECMDLRHTGSIPKNRAINTYVQYLNSLIYTESDFSPYISALKTEIEFVEKNGSRKYHLLNGHLISKTSTSYYYSFEKEDNQYFPDASEIKIHGFGYAVILSSDSEVVNICSSTELPKEIDFYLDTSEIIKHLYHHIENIIKNYNNEQDHKENKIIHKLLKLAKAPNFIDPKKEATIVNANECVKLSKKGDKNVMFIWGPPGTGKTYTLSKIAINRIKHGDSVLILSNSNVAVDGAAIRVRDDSRGMFPKGTILRYGYPHKEELINDNEITSYNVAISNNPQLKKKLEELQEENKKVKRTDPHRHSEILEEIRKLRNDIKNEEKKLVTEARFIATTVAKACMDELLYNRKFYMVIVDEASMLLVPQIIFAASLAKRRFVCIGDFQQLSPIVESDDRSILNNDIYDFTGLRELTTKNIYHKWLVMLNEQHRMHPDISRFISEEMYLNKLKSAEGMIDKVHIATTSKPLPNEPMVIVNTSGMLTASLQEQGSYFNILHAFFSVFIAMNNAKEKDVGIITPYREHSKLINCIVKDLNISQKNKLNITASTVHSFQGSEKDIIIYDVPDCYLQTHTTALLTNNKNNRLFNVAITRSKGKFISLLNLEWLENHLNNNTLFYKFISKIKNENKIVNMNSLFYENRNDQFDILDKIEAEEKFLKDIENATEIRMYIPTQIESDWTSIEKVLQKKQNSKITIVVNKAEDDFPIALQKTNTSNINIYKRFTINPITIFDNKIIWYGKPLSKKGFKSKKNICPVTKYPIIRFVGENTARKIYSLL